MQIRLFAYMCLIVMMSPPLHAQTPIAIHATEEERLIWVDRITHGPYTEDWNRILFRANNFVAHLDDIWLGNQLNEPWDGRRAKGEQFPNAHPHRRLGDGLRDAGFVYLVVGGNQYRDAVLSTLLQQASIPGTDFTNQTKWPDSASFLNYSSDQSITIWLRKLLYGYSYIRNSVPKEDQATLDKFFEDAALYWTTLLDRTKETRFPNRLNDDYSLELEVNEGDFGFTHFNGFLVDRFSQIWNNHFTAAQAYVGAVGAFLNNPILIEKAKRYFKEWIMFAVYANGTVHDQWRWNTGGAVSWNKGGAVIGYGYVGVTMGSIITIADHLARIGDTELYEFMTSFGAHGSAGGPKSLIQAMCRYASIALKDIEVYGSLDAELTPDELLRPGDMVRDLAIMPANVYYRNELVQRHMMREVPEEPRNGGYDEFGGDWGSYPSVRFMFGHMEDLVWPYPVPKPESRACPANILSLP